MRFAVGINAFNIWCIRRLLFLFKFSQNIFKISIRKNIIFYENL
ncbi:hypothetical protein CCS77_1149 [Campylobacter concisus]|uniref:Uncharacterized protein n=1 Tax=Campylobacter concisus TaxID=199 RepID=A0A2R4P0J2_9BACT|nr:hypothetical protein CCS77_1149 [Campylobacter concisus]